MDAIQPSDFTSAMTNTVTSWFMANLPAVLGLIALLIAVSLVIRLVRKHAK